jgi:hypothetical protein
VAVGDVNNDNFADIITGAGAGGGPHVKVFSGADCSELMSFFAYDAGFGGGVFVAAGDVDGDNHADVITGAGAGGGPHVKVFSGQSGSVIRSFFAYDAGFAGGVHVAAGDVNNDSFADIITGAGAGGGPHVQVFSGTNLSVLSSFFAYDAAFSGGVNVGSGDVDGNGVADIITGAGAGGGPHVRAFDVNGNQLASYFAYDPSFSGGVKIASSPVGSALRIAGGVGLGSTATLEIGTAQRAYRLAVGLWSSAGVNTADIARLSSITVNIADLSGDLLGLATGSIITLDIDAAGHGWSTSGGTVDLLTVLGHELGHVLGLDDLRGLGTDIMQGQLEAGTTKTDFTSAAQRVNKR